MVKKQEAAAPTGQVNKWDALLAADAGEAAAVEESVSSGRFISTKNATLSYGGVDFEENKMEVIILDHIIENHLYNQRFDPNNPVSPICFAFGRKDADMAPHEASEAPQCESCKDCEFNQWGTADTGRGKACKNIRRMALLPADALESGIEEAEVAFFKIPVTSVKTWAKYVKGLKAKFERPPYAFVTEVSLVDDEADQFHVVFKVVSAIEDPAQLEAIYAKRESIGDELMIPYDPNPEQPPQRANTKFTKPSAARPVVPAKGKK